MNNRWILLAEVNIFGPEKWIPIYEAPKDKFHSICLATQQEIGLFVLKSLPRAKGC